MRKAQAPTTRLTTISCEPERYPDEVLNFTIYVASSLHISKHFELVVDTRRLKRYEQQRFSSPKIDLATQSNTIC